MIYERPKSNRTSLGSKFKLLEKIGVRTSTSTKLRRRSCTANLAREKAQSYPNCHTIINDATLIELGNLTKDLDPGELLG